MRFLTASGGSGSSSGGSGSAPPPGNIEVKVLGQSGKFFVGPEPVQSDPSSIVVTMDYLEEVDSSGSAVGTSGNVKHSFNSFASQSFNIEVSEESVPIGSDTAMAKNVSFTSQLSGLSSKLSVETLLLTDAGKVGPPNEEWDAKRGDLKWSITLHDWEFCNPCKKGQKDQIGAFVDLGIEVKGKNSATEKAGNSKSFDLGDNVTLDLSNQVRVDGVWQTMATGYPKVEVKGGKQLFIFRFPKFAVEAYYDPLLGTSSLEDDSGTDLPSLAGPSPSSDSPASQGTSPSSDSPASQGPSPSSSDSPQDPGDASPSSETNDPSPSTNIGRGEIDKGTNAQASTCAILAIAVAAILIV